MNNERITATAHDGTRFELAARRDDRTFSLEGVKKPDTSRNRRRSPRSVRHKGLR